MKVGICTADTHNERSGIGNYIHHLITHLDKKKIDLIAIRHESGINGYGIEEIVPWYPLPKYNSMYWSGILTIQKNRFSFLDILHSPTLCLFPIKPHKKYILTVHDIVHFLFPDLCTQGTVRYTRLLFLKNLLFADIIISDSEATKRDLITHYSIPEQKIRTIPLAASKEFHPLSHQEKDAIRIKYKLFKKFILFVGSIEPRKNIPLLLKAYSSIRNNFPDIELVIAGGMGWKYESVFNTFNELHLEDSTRFLGYVPHEDLPGLYNAAEVFVYPSLYEGFGLPPLEAMQCGIPVITTNVSSLPEVVGNGGLMVNPEDYIELAKLISQVLSNTEFNIKNREYNIKQAKKFSWEKTASDTYNVYLDAYQ